MHKMDPIQALIYLSEKIPNADHGFLQSIVVYGSKRGLTQDWLKKQVRELNRLNQPDNTRKRPRDGDEDMGIKDGKEGGAQKRNRREEKGKKSQIGIKPAATKVVFETGGEDIVDIDRAGIEYYLKKKAHKRTQRTKVLIARELMKLIPGLDAKTADEELDGRTVFKAYVRIYDQGKFEMELGNDTSMVIPSNDSVADQVRAAKRYLRRRITDLAEQEIVDLAGDDEVQVVGKTGEANPDDAPDQPDKEEAPTIKCLVCQEDIPEADVVRCRKDEEGEKNGTRDINTAKHAACRPCFLEMARNDIASPEKRVRCPGEKCPRERCPALFSFEQFEFLLDQNTELYDFKLFVALWQKEYVDESLKANPDYEVCPFCYYIDSFEGLPKHEHPLFKCKSEDCGKLSCRLCRSLAHEGKTCQEAKMPDLAEDVEEQTQQLTQLLNEAISEGRFLNCSRCKVGIELESGCNKILCTCNHYQCYYCRASLVAIKDEDDIQVAQKKAEDALKKSLANPGGLDARAIQLRNDYAQKRKAADKKAYEHFKGGPATIYRTSKCPLYSNTQQLHCMNQVRGIMMMESRILDHYQDRVNKNVLDDLIKKLMIEQRESWDTLIRDAKLDLAANPFPGDEAL